MTVPAEHEYRALRAVGAGEKSPAGLANAVAASVVRGHVDRDSGTLTEAGTERLAVLHEVYGPPDWTTCDHEPIDRPHDHRFLLRRDPATGRPSQAVMWAVWMGGFQEVLTWPWDAAGLTAAQAWCDSNGAIWYHTHYPIRPGGLAIQADAI